MTISGEPLKDFSGGDNPVLRAINESPPSRGKHPDGDLVFDNSPGRQACKGDQSEPTRMQSLALDHKLPRFS